MESCLVIVEFRAKLNFSPIGRTLLFHAAKTHYLVCKTLAVYSYIRWGGEAYHKPGEIIHIRLNLQPNHNAMQGC